MTPDGAYLCPGWPGAPVCAGGETYCTTDLLADAAMTSALRVASAAFAAQAPAGFYTWRVVERPARKNQILPMTTRDRVGRPVVYLPGSTLDQILFQAAHESVHLLCTPPTTFHWTHELVAVLFSLEALKALGQDDYRRNVIADLEGQARELSLEDFMSVTTPVYPPGMYGRAAVFGRQLAHAVGPAGYRSLVRSFGPDGTPDYWGWVNRLPRRVRQQVIAISPARPPIA